MGPSRTPWIVIIGFFTLIGKTSKTRGKSLLCRCHLHGEFFFRQRKKYFADEKLNFAGEKLILCSKKVFFAGEI